MKKNQSIEPSSGVLTIPINLRSREYKELRAFIKNKADSLSEKQKIQIELVALRIMMEDYLDKEVKRNQIISIGDFLRLFLNRLNIRQNKFAQYIGIKPSNLNKTLSGDRRINLELSLMLGNIFNTDPEIWINIQTKNDLLSLSGAERRHYSKFKLKDLIKE